MFRKTATILFVSTALCPVVARAQSTITQASVPNYSAYMMQNGEGVDTQIASADSGVSSGTLVADLAALGINHIRDADFTGNSTIDAEFHHTACPVSPYTAPVNYFTLLIASPNSVNTANLDGPAGVAPNVTYPLTARLAEAKTLSSECPGMVEAVEGPNEINNYPIGYNGEGLGCSEWLHGSGPQSGCNPAQELDAAERVVAAIKTYVQSTYASSFLNTKIDWFTGYGGNIGGNSSETMAVGPNPNTAPILADNDNAHTYPQNGSPPGNYWDSRTGGVYPYSNEPAGTGSSQPVSTQPAVATETGYNIVTASDANNLCDNGGSAIVNGVPEISGNTPVTADIAGKQTMMTYLDGVLIENINKVFIYKLLNDDASGFGLYTLNNDESTTITTIGTDVKNMNAIIHDSGATAAMFTPFGVTWSLTEAAHSNLINAATLEESDGSYIVAVWQEAQICQAPSGTTAGMQVAAPTVSLTLMASPGISIYDPTSSTPTTPVGSTSGSTISWTLRDRPLFFHVAG